MNKTNKFSPEVRERAVRLVQEHRGEYPSLWAAVESIAPKIGCVPQTLLDWVKREEVDGGQRDGLTTSERDRLKQLERENKELRRANEILKTASAFFAQAELDRRLKNLNALSIRTGASTGSSRSAKLCRLPRRATEVTQQDRDVPSSAVNVPSVMICW
jgi:transposase-like protein